MSKRVIIICTTLLLLGIAGGFDMLSRLTQGVVTFNILILFLPTSICLFLAIPGSRYMTSIVFFLIYLFLAVALVAPLACLSALAIQVNGVGISGPIAFPLVFVIVAVIGSVFALMHWVIYSTAFDEHLKR